MSEHNYAGLIFKTEREAHPEWFDMSEESVNAAAKRATDAAWTLHAKNDAAHPREPVRAEYNRLRKDLFDLQQHAKHMEIYCNEWAGKVKLLEQRITDFLKQKKAVVDNPLQERFCEHNIQLLETELLDAKAEFNRSRNQSTHAARGLKAFDGHERIKALKKELDTPKVIGKETDNAR